MLHQLAALRPAADDGTFAARPPCTLGIGMTPVSSGTGVGVSTRFGVGTGLIGLGTSGPDPKKGAGAGPGACAGADAGAGASAGSLHGGAAMCLLPLGGNARGTLMPGGTTKPLTWSTDTLYGLAVICFSTVAFLPRPPGAAEESMARPASPV